jgi:hypothetical protein
MNTFEDKTFLERTSFVRAKEVNGVERASPSEAMCPAALVDAIEGSLLQRGQQLLDAQFRQTIASKVASP